jgi:hypothetical protein
LKQALDDIYKIQRAKENSWSLDQIVDILKDPNHDILDNLFLKSPPASLTDAKK